MSGALPLFEHAPPVPHNGTDTSIAAARQTHAATDMARVYHLAVEAGALGVTCDEVEARLAMAHQTASARLWQLRKAGLVVDSGRRRSTRTGRAARVYVPTERSDRS